MLKRTLYFGNPAYLSLSNRQLVIRLPEVEKNATVSPQFKKEHAATRPIEDIGVVIIDHKQITITAALLSALLDNNCAVVTCNEQSLPTGLMLPLNGNTTQSERFKHQIEASAPLKKQLWQQTVKRKITNQAAVLAQCTDCETGCMKTWAAGVKSGDTGNLEARAAAYYWKSLFGEIDGFVRYREGIPPNNLLNYGYAILRAIVARALVASGLLPTFGIHHRNRYNAYCLADDIMEPYRPYVDKLVFDMFHKYAPSGDIEDLTKEMKAELLSITTIDVKMGGKTHPLMVAADLTASSLYKCFAGELRHIAYPVFV